MVTANGVDVAIAEPGCYPVLEHLKLIAGGPVVWAPGMDGSLVMEEGEVYDLLELLGRNFDFDPNRQNRQPMFKRLWFLEYYEDYAIPAHLGRVLRWREACRN